jgi:hypothetical protein
MLADRRRRAVGLIGASHVWPIASVWVDGIAAGLEKTLIRSPSWQFGQQAACRVDT